MCGILIESSTKDIIKNEFIENLKNIDNRGRECFGISYLQQDSLKSEHYKYRVIDYNTGNNKDDIEIIGKNVIGHTRYSTSANKNLANNTQPLESNHKILGKYTLIHNGNIPFIKYEDGRSDTYHIIEYINNSNCNTFIDILKRLLYDIKCVYCLGILDNLGNIYICKDKYGIRPLNIAYYNNKILICSETTCFEKGYSLQREIHNGEIIHIKSGKLVNTFNYSFNKPNICSFEYIYFMNEKNLINNTTLYNIRYQFGEKLASFEKEVNKDAIVIGMPNTGIPIGKGFADSLNLKYEQVITKSNNCGRSFILPTIDSRNQLLKKNLYYNKEIINGKIIYIIDDSIVRGITLKQVIDNLKKFNAREIHIRVASPPIISPCFYGIDIPSTDNLIAYNKTIDEITTILECNSLVYLDIENISYILKKYNMCDGCFSGKYPTKLDW